MLITYRSEEESRKILICNYWRFNYGNEEKNSQNQEVSFLLFVSGLFFIGVVKEFFERIHFVIPECLVRFEPVCHFFEFVELSITVSFPALLFDGDQSAFSEDADMFGNGWPAHIEMFGNTVECQLLSAQQLKDLSAGGVCDGLKNITSHAPVFAAKINVTDRILITISDAAPNKERVRHSTGTPSYELERTRIIPDLLSSSWRSSVR